MEIGLLGSRYQDPVRDGISKPVLRPLNRTAFPECEHLLTQYVREFEKSSGSPTTFYIEVHLASVHMASKNSIPSSFSVNLEG